MIKINNRINSLEIMLFFRHLAALISARIPIVQGLDILRQTQSNTTLQKIVLLIKMDLEAGNTFSKCLSKFPRFFDVLTCQLIQAGEYSGTLPIALERIALYKEKVLFIKNKIKQVLFYPSIVLIVALMVTIIMLTLVIPRFAELFQSMHSTLPAFTVAVIHLSDWVRHYYWTALVPLSSIVILICYMKRSIAFHCKVERCILRLPHIGSLYTKIILSRFCRTLAITLTAGVPMSEILKTIAHANGSHFYGKMILKLQMHITKGQQLHQAMYRERFFPPLLVTMVRIGEESGTISKMLEKIASLYESDIDHWVTMCSHLLEPLIIGILGVLIGGLVIAMYLPIFKLGTVM